MSSWVLIIAIGGIVNVSDVQLHPDLTEAQCKAAVVSLAPIQAVGAACIGPGGEVFDTDEVRR